MAVQTHADWIGRTTYDADGSKVGEITNIYLDDTTGQPEWLTVKTGWFGMREHFVPIAGTNVDGDALRLGYTEDLIKNGPSIEPDGGHLDEADERRLYAHYGFDPAGTDYQTRFGGQRRADEGYEYHDQSSAADASTTGRDRSGILDGDRDDASVVRSEEDLDVHTREHEGGRVRLRKYVVTEDVNVTVPVRKQIARVTREPVTAADGAATAFTDDEQEIVLTEEEVDVSKHAVAKERVGVDVDTVTEQRDVHETVRKEQVEVEGADRTADDRLSESGTGRQTGDRRRTG